MVKGMAEKTAARGTSRRGNGASGRRTIVQGLNPAQRKAVQSGDGSLLVLAGPGSGKTRVIAHRVAYLLGKGVPPGRILALTFTNKAAAEMARRVSEIAGPKGNGVWTSTFHSFCARILRIEGNAIRLPPSFVIYDADDSNRLIRNILREEKIKLDGLLSKGDLRARISLLKNRLTSPGRAPATDPAASTVKRVYGLYQRALAKAGALDFDDLLARAVDLFQKKPEILRKYADRFLHILVDEYQDTNGAQARLLGLLASRHRNVCVTGDPDQSIYGWRGATVRNILAFPQAFPGTTVVKLEQGYRSTKRIIEAADRLIRNNRDRFDRVLWTGNPQGPPVQVIHFRNREAEAEQIAVEISARRRSRGVFRDVAVLYRVNSYSRAFEQAFVRRRIPYTIVGGVGFYERREVKDLISYLRLLVNPADTLSFERIANVPPRGVGPKALASLLSAAAGARKSPIEAVRARIWEGKVRGSAATGLAALAALYDKLAAMPPSPVAPVLEALIERSGYRDSLASAGEEERLENVDELIAGAEAYDAEPGGGIQGFLERVALVTDVDRWDDRDDRVTLMTLHMAKGLEFPVVFIAGLEQGLLPFIRRTGRWWEEPEIDPERLEEERRLCFVGMTRAKELLVLTRAEARSTDGWDYAAPSIFLDELPPDVAILRSRASGRAGSRRLKPLVTTEGAEGASGAGRRLGAGRRPRAARRKAALGKAR